MNSYTFDWIHDQIISHLLPKRNVRPDAIRTQERLGMVLEYLQTGSSQKAIAAIYRVSEATMCLSVKRVCNAICEELLLHAFVPYDKMKWLSTSNRFNIRWNLPNCLSSIDGKHIRIKCPRNGASMFYNFKVHENLFSSLLLFECTSATKRK